MTNDELHILFEDSLLIVCVKKPGVPVESKRLGEKDMVSILKNYLAKKGEVPYIALINRLDQPVEGIMVVAKNQKAAAFLSESMRNREIEKNYYCVALGAFVEKKGTLKDYLLRDGKNNTASVVDGSVKDAKEAVLDYEVLEEISDEQGMVKTLLRIILHTGRHHQIRVQMAHFGHPLVGDRKYGNVEAGAAYMPLGLCSSYLSFLHPESKKEMTFSIIPKGQAFASCEYFDRMVE